MNQFEDKGKIFTNIISKNHARVRIQTATNHIKGIIHIGLDERLKDELNKSEMFIAITDASIYNLKGKLMHRSKFLALNLTRVIWLYQDEDEETTGDDNDDHAER